MTTTIWIIKGILAALFGITGLLKLFLPKDKLIEKGMKGLVSIDDTQIKGIGVVELLGAIGILLPGLLNIYPILSGIAALGLALTMMVAARVHQKLQLSIMPNIIIMLLCLFVAYKSFA